MSDNKKISNWVDLKTKKASILVYSIILVFVLIIMAVGAAQVMLTDEKGAISSRETTQAFQVADSGVEIIRRQIALNPNDPIASKLPCGGGIITENIGNGKYEATLYLADGSMATCGNKLGDIRKIKSNGTFAGNSRAVEVAVATSTCASGAATEIIAQSANKNFSLTQFNNIVAEVDSGAIIAGVICYPGNTISSVTYKDPSNSRLRLITTGTYSELMLAPITCRTSPSECWDGDGSIDRCNSGWKVIKFCN